MTNGSVRYPFATAAAMLVAAFLVCAVPPSAIGQERSRKREPYTADHTSLLVSISADRWEIEAGQAVTLLTHLTPNSNHEVNYRWKAERGQIDGSGPKVTFDTTGLEEGSYTVVCLVFDALGHSAECSTTIRVLRRGNRCPSLTLAADKVVASVGEIVNFTATSGSEQQPQSSAHYTWTTSGGSLQASDATALLDTTGLSDNSRVVVTVTSDAEPNCSDSLAVRISTPRTHCGMLMRETPFETNSAELAPRAIEVLNDTAQSLIQRGFGQADPGGKLFVFGFTDSDEPVGLGIERARAVRAYLVQVIGLDGNRILACSWVGTCGRAEGFSRRVTGLVVDDDTPAEYVESHYGCEGSARLYVDEW